MERRTLGGTGLALSVVGLGGWQLGKGVGAGVRSTRDLRFGVDIVLHALDCGIDWIDVAAVYGRGFAETVVGEALRRWRTAHGDGGPIVLTKCGFEWDESSRAPRYCLSADSVRRSVEASLGRLGVETLDICLIHWPVPEQQLEEGWQALAGLRAQGSVRHAGLSNCTSEQLRACCEIAPVEVVEVPYSLAQPGVADDLLPSCAQGDVGVVVYAPQGTGLLTGALTRDAIRRLPAWDDRAQTAPFREPALTRNLRIAEQLRDVAIGVGATAGQLAVAWALGHPVVASAIVGCESRAHVDDAVAVARRLGELQRALVNAGLLALD